MVTLVTNSFIARRKKEDCARITKVWVLVWQLIIQILKLLWYVLKTVLVLTVILVIMFLVLVNSMARMRHM